MDDKIITKERALEAGIHVPEMYGIIETREKGIDKLEDHRRATTKHQAGVRRRRRHHGDR
ncbi:hypothetical protein ACPA9J_08555 [Pseudomonas aeruginosa]